MGLSMRELSGVAYREPFIPTAKHIDAMQQQSLDYDFLVSCLHKGFFPELYETESDLDDWSDYYNSYLQTYLEKDIRDELNIKDESAFIKFIRAVASFSGLMLNVATISEMCGKDAKTVRSWLSVLESSGLVFLLEPYSNNHCSRLVKTPKLYFLDTGLACWLLGWNTPEQLVRGALWGQMFESFVFAEILKSYYNDGKVKPPLFYYRDSDKNEIDLLIESGETLHPVEIKTTSDPTTGMIRAFRKIEGIPLKKRGAGAVVCLAKECLPLTEDTWIMPASML
jgi:predicted AAA+ superfamily ATPase